MSLQEINFEGIIGPSHNYAGLSPGNIASSTNAGATAYPKEAALQGIAKMRHNMKLGLAQGFFMPLDRPNINWLEALGTDIGNSEPHIRAAAFSASSMWAANAATISPAADTRDGKCHLTVANLQTMAHRSHEWPGTLAQLRLAFSDPDKFAVHGPIPSPFGDEGAANHMRLCASHEQPGLEIFVYGKTGGPFPARQHIEASKAIARKHGLETDRTIFTQQSETAIAAGAFHNDVVAVANERVLFTHELAFEHPQELYGDIEAKLPDAQIIIVPADRVSLSDAISSYLFNAQLVTLPDDGGPDDGGPDDGGPDDGGPDDGGMALILPTEAKENAAVWSYLKNLVSGNGPIRKLCPVDVRQSMANGGGPACLRLRVVAEIESLDQRFIATPEKLDQIAEIIAQHWPKSIAPHQLSNPDLVENIRTARGALLSACDLVQLHS